MKDRKTTVAFIKLQLSTPLDSDREKCGRVHYGAQELRQLLDFIYAEKPQHTDEKLHASIFDMGAFKK